MNESERQAFLDHFKAGSEPVIGFAVLGGIFAEGIDLKGTQLIGVAIVSVGLPGSIRKPISCGLILITMLVRALPMPISCQALTMSCRQVAG